MFVCMHMYVKCQNRLAWHKISIIKDFLLELHMVGFVFPGVKSIPDDTPVCRILLRKEVLRLVINLSSSVGTKGHETGLLK